MRILFTGATPWTNSGYGKPLRYLLPRLARAGHELGLAAFYGWRGAVTTTSIDGADIRIYGPARDPFSNDIIEYHANSFGADLVVSLQDVWLLNDWSQKPMRWLPWMPIDTETVPVSIRDALNGCDSPLSFSRHGRAALRAAGWYDARYMPFGVDLETYKPVDKTAARARLGLPDTFTAGMIAANSSYPSRKSFPEVLQAWRNWRRSWGQGLLYIHATLSPKRERKGVNFPMLLEALGLNWATLDDPSEENKAQADVMFPCQYLMWCHGYDDETLADLYNSFDVLLSPSMGEGFGIPILEAQACGVPVITLNVTSMPEITFSGICLEPIQRYWFDQGSWRGVVGVDDLVHAIDQMYQIMNTPTGREHYSRKARASVEAYRFGWDDIVEHHWTPLLEEINEQN